MKTCAVVGCHPKRFKFKYKETHTGCKRLKDQFIKLYAQGVRIFVIGSFLGVDIWSGEILLTLRKEPGWDEHNRTRLSFLKEHAEVVFAGHESDPASYYKQSQYLLRRADRLVAVFDMDYTVRSRVGQIVNKAAQRKIPIIYIHPDTGKVT